MDKRIFRAPPPSVLTDRADELQQCEADISKRIFSVFHNNTEVRNTPLAIVESFSWLCDECQMFGTDAEL